MNATHIDLLSSAKTNEQKRTFLSLMSNKLADVVHASRTRERRRELHLPQLNRHVDGLIEIDKPPVQWDANSQTKMMMNN